MRLLISFANAVFDWLDNSQAPKGSGMLEPQKMDVIQVHTSPVLHRECGPLLINMMYQAYSVETVFTASGPALTRAGFLAYLRAEIMCDPDFALKALNGIVTASRVGPSFDRSQFPRLADPGLAKTWENVQVFFPKLLDDIQSRATKHVQQEKASRNQQAQKTALLNMATRQADAQFARNAAASERMGWIGTNVCYSCGQPRCRCGSYDTTDLMGSI